MSHFQATFLQSSSSNEINKVTPRLSSDLTGLLLTVTYEDYAHLNYHI